MVTFKYHNMVNGQNASCAVGEFIHALSNIHGLYGCSCNESLAHPYRKTSSYATVYAKISATHWCGVCTTVRHNPCCHLLFLLYKEISPITTILILQLHVSKKFVKQVSYMFTQLYIYFECCGSCIQGSVFRLW